MLHISVPGWHLAERLQLTCKLRILSSTGRSRKKVWSKEYPALFWSLVAGLSIAFFPVVVFGQDSGITDLGSLPGGLGSRATGVSGNGMVVVGEASGGGSEGGGLQAFRWTQSAGMSSLGFLNGGDFSIASGVNSDGSVVVGHAVDGAAGFFMRAFRWTPGSGMVSLGVLNGGVTSTATGVNADGSVVVGTAYDDNGAGRAFRWTQTTGMVNLGLLNGGIWSTASAVNRDGSVVIGAADAGGGRAFRWTQGTGMVNLGVLNGGGESFATSVNSDGSVIAGFAFDGAAGHAMRAFRWTQASGMVSLGTLNGGVFSNARGVNGDGSVVVGAANDGATGNETNRRAFRWTQATGMQSVESWLRAHGISVPADVTGIATGVSDDGDVVVGDFENRVTSFIARVSSLGGGLISINDLQSSLSGNRNALLQAASLGSLVLNGVHSRPLARRADPGKLCLWAAGDIGRDDHAGRDGSFEIAEVGGCRRLAHDTQGSLSIGRTSSRQNLVFNGRSEVRTTYGVAELLGRIPETNLWPSVALLYQAGDADARRGYVNAGIQDYSTGRPGTQTTALRVRLDWENAARRGAVSLTPYGDVTHAHTRIRAYSETGGGFPARFDSRTEKATEFRLGVDAAYVVSVASKLLGRVEAAHRLEKGGASTSGTVLGLFSFDFPGEQHRRDWLRAGVGLEMKLGNGLASVTLNGTTQGGAPSYWLNASYQLTF